MPSLNEVEQFKYLLNEMGDEPEILAERDEEIEDIPAPEQGLPEGLSDLFETPEGTPEEPGLEAVPGQQPPEPSLEQPAAPAAAPAEEAVDLSDLLGDEDLSGLDILDGVELPEGEPEAAAPEVEAPEAAGEAEEGPVEAAEFELPEIEAGPEPELVAEVPPEPSGPEAPDEEIPVEEFSLEEFDFELPEEATPEEAVPQGVAPEEAAPEAGETGEVSAEGLSLEDLGLELPEAAAPELGEAEEAPAEAEATPIEEAAEEPTVEKEPAGEADEFAIPPGLIEPGEEQEIAEAAPEGEVFEAGLEEGAQAAPEAEFELPEEFALPVAEEVEGVSAEGPGEAPEFEIPTEEITEEATAEAVSEEIPLEEALAGLELEEATEAPEMELPEEEAPPAEEGITAEELPEMPGFEIEGLDAEAFAAPEVPEAPEVREEAPTEEAFGEAEFELPEEFQLPEEAFGEEAAPEAPVEEAVGVEEGAAEPTEEEAEFLKVLQDEVFPGEEAAAEQPAEAPGVEEAFAEVPLEAEAPVEKPPEGEVHEGIPAGEEVSFPEGEQIDLEAPAEAGEGVEEYALDEFSLEGLGEAFPVEAEVEAPPVPEEEIPAKPPVVEEQFPEEIALPGAEELTFTDKQFAAIKRAMSQLPRNLKVAIEELIAEKGLEGEDLRSLLALLIEGAPPTAIAERVSRITGQRIVLPKSFERLTGVAFEERRRTFAYAFRENILPILRVVVLSLAFLGLLAFLGYRYVYRPLYANYLYRQGYSQIEKERYRMANDGFDRATSVWVFKNWFYRYAQGFKEKDQFQLAAEKYEQLLRRFPRDKTGKLSYASLLTFHLAGYEKADTLLDEVLTEDIKDYNALLAKGDNYLEWAQEDESRYADARFAYASIIDYYGEKDEVLFRMMRYFIRTDKFDETRTLKNYLDDKKNLRVEPELYASTYAELAGYWIDKGQYDSIPSMLFKAMEEKMNEPGIHYQLARYYRYVQDPGEEEKALAAAIQLLERMQPLDKQHLFMVIDSYNRRGETFWRKDEYLEAEEYFQKAIDRIEDAQRRKIFGQREEFGLVYKNYGDIYYYISHDLEPALDLYLRAVNNRYETPDLDYKMGYIHYAADRYEDALLSFSKVIDQRPTDPNGLYALANSLYLRGYYSSAQGYYLRLLNLLESREERIPFLQVYENPEHNALVEYIMKVYNNLGVTLKQLADRSRDPDKESKALVNMTFSSERFDLLSRDPVTVERGLTKNLAYLNQGGILYPTSEFQLQIYTRLPVDMEAARF
jgi:tetratricopeptide (TPR) repeat protein